MARNPFALSSPITLRGPVGSFGACRRKNRIAGWSCAHEPRGGHHEISLLETRSVADRSQQPVVGRTPSSISRCFSNWSAPVNLGPTINSSFIDFTPEISRDGLSLYFSSNRPGGSGLNDLWVAQRPGLDAEWGLPINLGTVINTGANEAAPHLSRDGHYLVFTSNRAEGGFGSNDLWVSRRVDIHDDLAWEEPVNLGPPVNGPSFDAGATLWHREFYFTSDRESTGPPDVFVSLLGPHGALGPPVLVPELSSEGNDLRPSIRFDGLEIFVSSNRAGSLAGSQDVWVSTREHPDEPWSPPANLGAEINTEFQEQQPAISGDGTVLLFGSDRPGGNGGLDLCAASRVIMHVRP
jgi:WD40-like Beta Propeller Repeat